MLIYLKTEILSNQYLLQITDMVKETDETGEMDLEGMMEEGERESEKAAAAAVNLVDRQGKG